MNSTRRRGKRLAPDSPVHSLAHYSAIEAPHIFRNGDFYYLFVNWDRCCRGVHSTYNIRVGRSRKITGPYLDKDGVDLMKGGATLLLETDGPFIGPGHANIFEEHGKYWFSCHFYDSTRRGRPTLAIRPLRWADDGWPALEPVVAGASSQSEAAVNIPQGFIIGADISWVQAAEDRGFSFSDRGVEKDIFDILKDHGFNYIRLRVFHDPARPTPRDPPYSRQGYCDLSHTTEMAKRVKAADMGLLVNFHYSDSWADPGKQFTPSAWAGLSFEELVAVTRNWTRNAIARMRDAGAQPEMVQIGNEITPGMMTDRGGSVRDWNKLAQLLKAGIAGVKDVDPKILVMLHLDRGGDNKTTRWWVNTALAQNVQFDILGLSCYTRWHGPPSSWKANFEDLVTRYAELSFLIVEFGAKIAEANQIMYGLPRRKGLGTFIWEPTANNNGQALFDRRGAVIPDRMRLYDEVAKRHAARTQ